MCHFTFSFYIFFSYSQNTDFSVASCPLLILFLVHWWTFGGFHILHSALLVYLEVHWDPYFQGDLEILINGYDWSARIGLIGKQFEWEGFRTHFKARHSPWSIQVNLTDYTRVYFNLSKYGVWIFSKCQCQNEDRPQPQVIPERKFDNDSR